MMLAIEAANTSYRPSSWLRRTKLSGASGELPDLFPKPVEVLGILRPSPKGEHDNKDLDHDKKRSITGLLAPWIQLLARRPMTTDDTKKSGGRISLDFEDFDLA